MKVILFWLIFCTISIFGKDSAIENILGNLDNDVADRSMNKQGLLIKKNLTSDKIIKRTYYKSGNVKNKTIAIPSAISKKRASSTSSSPELMISKEYYDNVDGAISKIKVSFLGNIILEVILSDEGKEKCGTEFEDFDDFVYKELIDFKNKDINFKDFDNNKQVMKTSAVLAFLLMPVPSKKKIRCFYDDVYLNFDIKGKGITKDISLDYANMTINDSRQDVNNLEEVYNLLNKYYVPDESVTDKVKKYKTKIMDFFK